MTSVTAVTVAVRGHVAQERDLAERVAWAERPPRDLDLSGLDHVEAVAGVTGVEHGLAGRDADLVQTRREVLEHALPATRPGSGTRRSRSRLRGSGGDPVDGAQLPQRRAGSDGEHQPDRDERALGARDVHEHGPSKAPIPIAASSSPSSVPSTRPSTSSPHDALQQRQRADVDERVADARPGRAPRAPPGPPSRAPPRRAATPQHEPDPRSRWRAVRGRRGRARRSRR